MLRLTPTERLRRHESWRLFARKALKDAELKALREACVEFVGGGGLSAVLQGVPVVTQDLEPLLSAHPGQRPAHGVRTAAIPSEAARPTGRHSLEGEDLDLLAEMSRIGGYDDVVPGVIDLEVGGHPVRVLPLDWLVANEARRRAREGPRGDPVARGHVGGNTPG